MSSSLIVFFLIFAGIGVAQNTLTVAAAADLSSLESDLASSFGKTAPDVRVRFVTESSAALAQQIENGAPYDVFMSANAQFVDKLALNGKLLTGSVRPYVVGRLGLLWKDRGTHDLNYLANTAIHVVALPNPKLAPYGVAAQQAIERAGIWPQVQPKVVYGENVRQTLQMFETGNADAVLTSASLLVGKSHVPIPSHWHKPILQKAGIVATTGNREAAEGFLRFLSSPAGQAVFTRYGFGAP
ncbi:MAG: molybdate ABC transporter substrate-binding protein [Acidobacteriota bacterium]|nr:molybdate ABC transporter substrate-binding protein [Acidobacteriota bacterium]